MPFRHMYRSDVHIANIPSTFNHPKQLTAKKLIRGPNTVCKTYMNYFIGIVSSWFGIMLE